MINIELRGDDAIYKQIRDDIRQRILEGDLEEGSRLPTDQDMCELLGVSMGPIKWAYRDLVNEGLIVRKPGPGGGTFVTRDIPRPRSFSTSRDIGVVFYDLVNAADAYRSNILAGSSRAAEEMGYMLHMFGTKGRSICNGNDLLRDLISRQAIAGLLVLHLWSEDEIRQLQVMQCPFVVIDNDYRNLGLPTVMIDDHQAAYAATRGLISEGHSKIGLVVSQWEPRNPRIYRRSERMPDGYQAALDEFGISYSKIIVKQRMFDDGDVSDVVRDIDDTLSEVTALVIDGDWLAELLCNHILSCGKTIGKDIQVVVYSDNMDIPDTRTIYKPLFEAGEQAIRMLIDQIHGTLTVQKYILPVRANWE